MFFQSHVKLPEEYVAEAVLVKCVSVVLVMRGILNGTSATGSNGGLADEQNKR